MFTLNKNHRKCAILGASGHGKVVAEIAELNGYKDILFFDDRWPDIDSVEHWSVCGDTSMLIAKVGEFDLTIVAVGHNETRLAKQNELAQAGANIASIAHPSAIVSQYTRIGAGTVVMANAVVNPFGYIGEACIINTSATIDHDCKLADGVHISPGANLAGGVEIGKYSWIGIGSQVKQCISIGTGVTVGAGSTVVKNVPNFQTILGCPARPLFKK
ncbi:acetyltransferase [Vibrio breoganii]